MSNLVRFENLKELVQMVQPQFEELASIHKAVNYKREASFAIQALTDNDYLSSVAINNQDSLKNAVINVAAIGLSLSPVHKLAYLIPRKGKVCLDISYQGLKQLAVDCGAIVFCHTDIVYSNDDFILNGIDKEPTHKFKPFSSSRGDIVGGYCTAKTAAGDFVTSIMDIEEINKIKSRSESFIKKSGPWITDEKEMIKKTIIRRAYKSWTKSSPEKAERLAKAIELDDDYIETTASQVIDAPSDDAKSLSLEEIRFSLKFLERTEEQYLKHLSAVMRRDIKKLEDLTSIEISQAKAMLNQLTEQKNLKIKAEEKAKNEDVATQQ